MGTHKAKNLFFTSQKCAPLQVIKKTNDKRRTVMRKFFQLGGVFMVVALLCFAAGALSDKGATSFVLGAFWLVIAIAMRAKNAKKQPPPESPEGSDPT